MTKTTWQGLPQGVRHAIEGEMGAVVGTEVISGGLNSEVTLVAENSQRRVFIKGAKLQDTHRVIQMRREALVNDYVVNVSPSMHWQIETDGWLVLGFEYIEGRRADYSPNSPDIPLVLETLDALSEIECPNIPLLYSDRRHSNHATVEDLRRFAGNSLQHTDLNPGNVWISGGRAFLLDWARATRGAAWGDVAALALCLQTCGHTPRDAEAIVSRLPVWKTLEPGDLDASVQYKCVLRDAQLRRPIEDPWTNAAVEAARRWLQYRWSLAH